MKIFYTSLFSFLLVMISCNSFKSNTSVLEKNNVIAWCIVPFDANDRTPAERAKMLQELGINKYAYDYRDRHVPEFPKEIRVMQKNGIDITAVWLWIQDADGQLLDPVSEKIVTAVEESGLKTEFWLSFPNQFLDGLSDKQKFDKAVQTISRLNDRLDKSGCSIALYNHGDWFGNPLNQIRIIGEIDSDNIGIVYNFHHAHHEIDEFESIFPLMQPHLTAVNLNGMKKEGPKIIDLGKGDEEEEMIRFMLEKGYDGPIGILGHTEGEDIKLVLERNLEGLKKIRENLKK
ncbi:MAG: sugar phosphate isomerase/epimerase [Bacteroidales bacterium]|nr:sugar phosphate isomerase/epimerase [Bacteroidales bacterium]